MVTQVVKKRICKGSAMPHPKGRGLIVTNFGDPTYTQTVWPRATIFGMIRPTHVWSSVFPGVSHAPIRRGGASASPKYLWPTCGHTIWEPATKFCMVIKLDVRKILQGPPQCWSAICLRKYVCFLPAGLPQSGKLPLLNLLTGQKSVFLPAGATRFTDSRQTWHGRRARGFAWLCKISPQSAQGVGIMRPQNMKNFHFW